MTHSTNGVSLGAIIGSAGGLIVDEIMRHREEMREKAAYNPPPESSPNPRTLQHRYQDRESRQEPIQ